MVSLSSYKTEQERPHVTEVINGPQHIIRLLAWHQPQFPEHPCGRSDVPV